MWHFIFGIKIPILDNKGKNLNKARGALVPARVSKIKYLQVLGLKPSLFHEGMNQKLSLCLRNTKADRYIDEMQHTWNVNIQKIDMALKKDIKRHILQLAQIADKKSNIRAIENKITLLKTQIGDRIDDIGEEDDSIVIDLKHELSIEISNRNYEKARINMSGSLLKATSDIAQALLSRIRVAIDEKRQLTEFYMHINRKGNLHFSSKLFDVPKFIEADEREKILCLLFDDDSEILSIINHDLGFSVVR